MRPGSEATATVTRGTKERGRFAIRDLSTPGARLVGELRLFEGEPVWLRLELTDPVELAAEVVRVDPQRNVAEVVFGTLAGDALAQIERAVAELVGRVREATLPTVLVVHPTVDISSALERDLARIGVGARVVATLAELAGLLADREAHHVGVIVSGTFGEAIGPVLQQLEEQHPELRRVVLFGEHIETIAHAAAARVHAVLRTPWRFKGLARALDVSTKDVVTTYDQLVALKMPIRSKD